MGVNFAHGDAGVFEILILAVAEIVMGSAEEYREHARDCIRLAQSAASPTDRARLIEMAERWVRLAERFERSKPKAPQSDDDEP